MTVAPGATSVIVSGLAYGRCTRAALRPLSPSTDTRVASVVVRVTDSKYFEVPVDNSATLTPTEQARLGLRLPVSVGAVAH